MAAGALSGDSDTEAKPLEKKRKKNQTETGEEGDLETPRLKTKKEKKKRADDEVEHEKDAEHDVSAKKKKKKDDESGNGSTNGKKPKQEKNGDDAAPVSQSESSENRVFVGGLPAGIEEAALTEHFLQSGKILKVEIPFCRGGGGRKGQSRGMAFITFKKRKGVAAALEMDGTEFQGKSLKVQMATSASDKKGPNRNQTRVFVGRLPKECTEEALKKDFAECGKIIDFVFPTNKDKTARGIAFITFRTREGADAALKFDGQDYGGRRMKVTLAGPAKTKTKDKSKKDKPNEEA